MRAHKDLELAKRTPQAVLRPTSVQIERELEVLSQLMDNQFKVPVLGWRFGLNAIIDLIPEFGDIATTIVALYVLVSAVRYRVPKITLLRMGVNIAIYFVGGLVPFAGDLFAVWWKPNIRNLNLLRRRATVSADEAKRARASDWLFVALIIGTLLALLFGSIALTLFFFLVHRNSHALYYVMFDKFHSLRMMLAYLFRVGLTPDQAGGKPASKREHAN